MSNTTNPQNDGVKNVESGEVKTVGKFDKFFGISKSGSSLRTEIVAGIVTFLAMCYILTVNPNQFFYNGIANNLWASVFMATAFGAIIGTLLMAFLAKLPLAQASGMGLNAMVGTIIGGGVGAFSTYVFEFTLANAMFMVLISGILFFILSVVSIKGKSLRQKIFEGIPAGIKAAIPVGIGLFIAFIGFQNAKVIVDNPYTLVDLVNFSLYDINVANAAVCLIGLIVIAILSHCKIKGAVIFGILFATIIGIPLGVTNLQIITGSTDGISWKFWENFGKFFSFGEDSVLGIAFKDGWAMPAGSIFTVIMIIISMCMIDMFDTMGTCVGCCAEAGLLDENGTPINYDKIMLSDSIATCTGALVGTSTVTTFVESGAGIAAGGKTGCTALVTAIMFFLAIFILPVFAMIPSAASASALVYVGVLMMKNVTKIDFTSVKVAVPAFLCIVVMPLGYSITKGIGIAILSYVVISIFSYIVEICIYAAKKEKKPEDKPVWDVSIITGIVAVLFIIYFFIPTVL